MRQLRGLVLLFGVVGGLSAEAAPVQIRSASTVWVVLGGKREAGQGLRPTASGKWQLALGKTLADEIELVDSTRGFHTRWVLPIIEGVVTLDDRFIADHAYRMQLRRSGKSVGSALVYLYPPKVRDRVSFETQEAPNSDDDAPIAIRPKGTL